MVRIAGLEPANCLPQSFQLRVFRCHSLPIELQHYHNDCKPFIASTGNLRQKFLCKNCVSLHRVQKLCKTRSLAGSCAKVVQIPAAESAPEKPSRRDLFQNNFRMPRRHTQKHPRRAGRLATALFPIVKRFDRDAQQRGELAL